MVSAYEPITNRVLTTPFLKLKHDTKYNIVNRMKSLIAILCLMATTSSFAAFTITSAQFDYTTKELFFTYT
ncbi:hypothetical protein GA0061070_10921, partial [Kosakonia oryziphila]